MGIEQVFGPRVCEPGEQVGELGASLRRHRGSFLGTVAFSLWVMKPQTHALCLSHSIPALVLKVLAKPLHPLGPVWKSLEALHSLSAMAEEHAITMQMLTAFGSPP